MSVNRPKEFLAWAVGMFGDIALNRRERLARFMEEAVELAQAGGMSLDELDRITWRVYRRNHGDPVQEIGQTQATLETLAECMGLSSDAEAQREFERVQAIPKEEWERRHAAKVAIGIARKARRYR